jgi:hypothetical protein
LAVGDVSDAAEVALGDPHGINLGVSFLCRAGDMARTSRRWSARAKRTQLREIRTTTLALPGNEAVEQAAEAVIVERAAAFAPEQSE